VVLRDHVKPGHTVFDIGAHVGALTQVLSRLTGPKGIVVACEANELTIPQLTANVIKNAHFNVFILHRAIYHTSGEYLDIVGDSANARIGERSSANDGRRTLSLALDDLAADYGLHPNVVKIDIEGGEYDALRGFQKSLAEHRPIIVFEHNVGDDRALEYLHKFGYLAFCTAQYAEIRSSQDCVPDTIQANLIAIHQSAISSTIFASRPEMRPIATYSQQSLSRENIIEPGGVASHRLRLDLKRGRYRLHLEARCDPASTLYTRITEGGRVTSQLWTRAAYFLPNHKDIVFDLARDGEIYFDVGELSEAATPSLEIQEVTLSRLTVVPPQLFTDAAS
jgi:FkbM family methyltransferase